MKRYCFLFLILLLCYCSTQKPFSVDNEEGGAVSVEVIHQANGTDFFFSKKRNMGIKPHLFLGKLEGNYTARPLLRFINFPDSIDEITDAKIILYKQGNWGAERNIFTADLYQINSPWEEYDVINWNEIDADSSVILASAEVDTAFDDTVEFNLDPQLVSQWTDTTNFHGIWIDSENATYMVDFNTRYVTPVPILWIKYLKDTEPDSASIIASNDTYIVLSHYTPNDDYLYLGKGVAYQSYLKFDFTNLIDSVDTINRARLKLTINQDESILGALGIRDSRILIVDDENPTPEDSVSTDDDYTGFRYQSIVEDSVYYDITGLVQAWVSDKKVLPNRGMLIKLDADDEYIARIALYSSLADSINAPKLIVTYTTPPPEF